MSKYNILFVSPYSFAEYGGVQSQIIYAKKGKLVNIKNNKYLILYNGKFINNDKGKTSNFSFEETKFNLSKYSTKSTLFD